MKVVIHDRTEELPVRVRSHAEQRLQRLQHHFDRAAEAEVEFERQSKRRGEASISVQISVRMDGRRHPVAQAREHSAVAKVALDRAVDKIDRQVLKAKEKIKVEKKRGAGHAGPAANGGADHGRVPERIRILLRPQSLEDAAAALDDVDQPFFVFLDEGSGDVNVCFRRPDGGLTVIEAVVS